MPLLLVLTLLGVIADPAAAGEAPPRPTRVVFVCEGRGADASGEKHVLEVLRGMKEGELFGVVVAGEGAPKLLSQRLLAVNVENIARARKFLDEEESHGHELAAAVGAALKLKPELIWVESDGWLGGVERGNAQHELAQVRKLNTVRCPINTTAMHRREQDRPEGLGVLWRLAHQNGGTCYDKSGQPIEEEPKGK